MKKNLIIISGILLFSLFMFSGCQKETADTLVSEQVAATLKPSDESIISAASKQNKLKKSGFSPWQTRSSGVSASQRFIIEMSEAGQTTCYGLINDLLGAPLHDITVTHDGGDTWHSQTIAGLENNYLFGVAATTAK